MAAKKNTTRFPKQELNDWVKGRTGWNHDEWLALLADLRAQGFGEYTDSAEGQCRIGEHIEAKRDEFLRRQATKATN